ncbi:alpha/beta hydrolase family protein [Microbacterium sp. CFBP9034]|uniref:alpha/beta hydrolase family protein n=1 Tax=Microbacterium sp. CFBP9034 TaxID=3096540 RepID=UPI002A69F52D|nr:alpha/beta fold hydrolase [Microbacterium sp. CFBP9034]MDY0908716.1 alpha/beta fold hydrolase [Microbacterium sp. CFBP9034]
MPVELLARVSGAAVSLVVVALALGGCSAAAPSPSPLDVSLPAAPTLRSLMDGAAEQPAFELVEETTDFDGDHAEVVTYRSGGLEIQAVIRRPVSGADDSPAIVLLHGDVDPDEYSGLTAYDGFADEFVQRGYVVVVPDLRNHGDSDDDPTWETDMDVGSTLDAINAARATAADPMVDPSRVAVVGHSHGGGVAVAVAVAAPDAAAAFAAAAPSHTSPWENIERFAAGTPYFETVVAAHGTPAQSPEYWRDVSSLTFVDRATAPLLIVHGTEDEIAPLEWSEDLSAAWSAAGKDATLVTIPGADHFFEPDGAALFDAMGDFLAEQMP